MSTHMALTKALLVTRSTTHTDLESLIISNVYDHIPQTEIDTQH